EEIDSDVDPMAQKVGTGQSKVGAGGLTKVVQALGKAPQNSITVNAVQVSSNNQFSVMDQDEGQIEESLGSRKAIVFWAVVSTIV
ncbi:unnamed protein product, partial [Ilex paraguariensis]